LTTFALCAGKLVIQSQFKAHEFLELARQEHMTHSLMVPAMYKLLLLDPSFQSQSLTHWRVGGYGGAPMPEAVIAELAQLVPRLELMNCYGSTETTSPATLMPRGVRHHPESVGMALPCAQICVMDDDGKELPHGQMGELWIKGPMVVPGYWNQPQASSEAIVSGWWRSGDLGCIDSEGYVRVMDRKKDMINRGGYKIYSIEVENVLFEHPAVQEAAVVSKPCPVLGERVHAWVSLRSPADAEALREHCAKRLSDYKVPESFTLVQTPLPRNANGKLLKRDMRELTLKAIESGAQP
jgi:acyl-CoA synthetase (AMP-forming)/AMP-acid ligase II